MIQKKEYTRGSFVFWTTRKGVALQIMGILLPSLLFLKSGNLLLAGVFLSVTLATFANRLQHSNWPSVGLNRPEDLKKVVLIVLVSTVIILIFSYILRHMVTSLIQKGPDLNAFNTLKGNSVALFLGLVIVWVFGAFGEEMLFRGFLMNAFYRLLPHNTMNESGKWYLSLIITSILTGCGHAYQGTTGMILTGVIGFCFGLIYLKSNRNLWPGIFTHGLYDTIAFIMVYLGFNFDQLIKGMH